MLLARSASRLSWLGRSVHSASTPPPPYGAQQMADLCKEYTMFSWSAQKAVSPIPMSRGDKCHFWDVNGKRYFDLSSQLVCINIGYNNRKVIEAIQKQAADLAYAGPGIATSPRAEIGPLLAKRTPGDLNKFFFTLGGAEANENAIKFARFYTGRHKIITRYRSYHGATFGAISLGGDPRRWPNEPGTIPGIIRVFDPIKYRSPLYREGDSDEEFSARMLKQLEETIIFENPNSIAAMFIETVTGSNGLIVPPAGYLPGLRKLLDKYGILLVCDEVMAGFGRTGEWFGVDNWNVVPDILTMAKGLTSAYMPLGCVAVSSKIAHAFDEKPFSGGLTYNGHPMSLAAAVASLKVLEEEKLIENSRNMGHVMARLHQNLKDKHPSIGDCRSIGLFGGIELVKSRKTKEPLVPFGGSDPTMTKFMGFLKEHGIFTFNINNVFFTTPPLCVTETELNEAFAVLDEALKITDSVATD